MQRTRIYLNAYAVSRRYGGPEEGGWWYNVGMPVESRSLLVPDLPEPEWTRACECAQGGTRGSEGCDMCGGHGVISPEDTQTPFNIHEILAAARRDTHITTARAEMEESWAEEDEGNIYSVNGGVLHEVQMEWHFAEPWPECTPHYE